MKCLQNFRYFNWVRYASVLVENHWLLFWFSTLMRYCMVSFYCFIIWYFINFMYCTLIVFIWCSWKHRLLWKSLACPQKQEPKMDTTHSWMTSRIPSFISVSPLTIRSRWSIDSTQVLAFTRITGFLFI
jgi:hypothetical protein